jgi:hypothetical protein
MYNMRLIQPGYMYTRNSFSLSIKSSQPVCLLLSILLIFIPQFPSCLILFDIYIYRSHQRQKFLELFLQYPMSFLYTFPYHTGAGILCRFSIGTTLQTRLLCYEFVWIYRIMSHFRGYLPEVLLLLNLIAADT